MSISYITKIILISGLFMQPLFSNSNGLISKKVGDEIITVISTNSQAEPLWFVSSTNATYQLKNSPNTLQKISSVYVSEKYNKIIMMSYTTSSPRLDMFRLTDILKDKQSTVFKTVNPYPNDIEVIGFKEHSFVYKINDKTKVIDLRGK